MRALIFQLSRFGLVGVAATMVHFLVAVGLNWLGMALLVANLIAFVFAFQVSYWGHSKWSFGGHGLSRSRSMFRFFTVSVVGFLINEALLFLLQANTDLAPEILLGIVLSVVAFLTFAASKFWAFVGSKSESEKLG